MREKDIEANVKRYIENRGGLCWKFASPGTIGVPDRVILLPGGRIVFAELKAAKGKLSDVQAYRIDQLRRLGFEVRVVRTVEDVHDL